MPHKQLPLFAEGMKPISAHLAVEKRDGQVTYFNGQLPVFSHAAEDIRTFRMITAQFCINGTAKQADIARAFGVTLISVKRAVKRYREQGVSGFYEEPKRRGAAVLTAEVLDAAQGSARCRRLFFSRLMQAPGADRLGQRIAFQTQLRGDFRGF